MSRYSLKPHPDHRDVFEVAVGWDSGLETYFAMVFGVAEPGRDPEVKHWMGGRPKEIGTVAALQEAVQDYAEITAELGLQLEADQDGERLPPPRRLSDFVARLLGA